MKIYKNCDTLPIYNFYKVIETNDYSFLIKNYHKKNVELTPIIIQDLQDIFKGILNEYYKISKNIKFKIKFSSEIDILMMEYEYDMCLHAINIYKEHGIEEAILILEDFDRTIHKNKDGSINFKLIENQLKGLKNKIKISKFSFANKYNKKISEEDKLTLDEEAVLLQMNLNINFIDVKKTSVTRWFSMINISNKKLKENGNTRDINSKSGRRNKKN